MTTVVDVNVIFAILVSGHAHHPAAWHWWQQQADESVGLCLYSRMGTLRLLSNTKAMGGSPFLPEKSLETWDIIAADPRCFWLEAEASHEFHLRRLVIGRQSSSNLWTDAWFAALASSNNSRLTSFDSDFRSFNLAHFEHLTL